MRIFLILTTVFITMLAFSPVAEARRATTTTERAQMQRSIRTNTASGNPGFVVNRFTYISTINRRWAYVNGTLTISGNKHPANTIMYKRQTDNRWIMKDKLISWTPCSWKTKMGAPTYNDVVRAACGG
jgi:hypothetical protein